MAKSNSKVLVVGQTPPPYGGQAVMIDYMLKGKYEQVELVHVRMNFSKSTDEIGKFKISKITELFRLIGMTLKARFKTGAKAIYYPPSSANKIKSQKKIGLYRDMLFLLCTRWAFSHVIFHFHASGLCDLLAELSSWEKVLANWAYNHPEAVIRISELAPEDGKAIKTKKEFIVPNGIEDIAKYRVANGVQDKPVNILFVAVICDSKGIFVLLEACRQLAERGVRFSLSVMGRFESEEVKTQALDFVAKNGLESFVYWLGVRYGEDKWEAFSEADIFTLPSYFESETFPVTLLEAASYGIPVVSTQWRAIPSIVAEGETGYLVPIKRPDLLADRLETLIDDDALRVEMGRAARMRFEQKYTLEQYIKGLEGVFQYANQT